MTARNGGGTRRWGWGSGRAENLRADAQAAQDAAAAAFYELDTAQRDLRISIETIGAVDDSAAGRKAVADFAEFGTRIDRASHDYITVVDRHELDRDDLDASAAAHARAELERARHDLERVKAELDTFARSLAPLVEKAEGQLARMAPAVERAKQALLGATNALDEARSSGLKADALAARLAALSPELTKLNEGAAQHGVQATVHRADEMVREAETIAQEARRLPERAAEIDKRIASLRTRTQALETRAQQVDPVLSELRRRFSAACWQDLQQVPERAAQSVAQAQQKLRDTSTARDEQRWEDAATLLAEVRGLLNDTDEAVKTAGERLQRLNDVSYDQSSEVDRTRFAIRDAQRLAMAGRSTPDPRHAQPLDESVERVDRAVASLTGRHPDYWRLLTELDAVKETVQSVVDRIRQERGGGR
ncbi:hypothetical protein [Streptomyces sulphureus]|uniref:hypothetical protein n=1 Tax=Streptomyces sulphureus TaxID=47758 RepID=UPI0003672B88|nr:hypothetical protein [Streptomyces sulphureus]